MGETEPIQLQMYESS